MNPRVTAVLFVLATLLGAFVYFHEIREDARNEVAKSRAARLFPDVRADAVDAIELTTSDGKRVRVERSDGGWRVREPVLDVADAAALDEIAGALEQLESEGQVEASPGESQFELGDESAALRFETGGRTGSLRIGRQTPVGANTYVQTRAEGPIYYVASWRLESFHKTLTELRDRRPLDFDQTEIEHLVVRWPRARTTRGGADESLQEDPHESSGLDGVELEKRGDQWWLLQPLEERADQQTIVTLLSDLAYLRAEGFIDQPASAADLGFDPPRFHVVLRGRTAEGERTDLGLDLGSLRGERIAARSMGRLFELAAERLEDFPRELDAYRFKQLARFDVADARRFALRFAAPGGRLQQVEGVWREGRWRTSPVEMDSARVGELLSELSRLEAEGIVADSVGDEELEALGLDPPRVRMQVWGIDRAAANSTGGERLEATLEGPTPTEDERAPLADVELGIVEPGRGWLARRGDSAIVYRLSAERVDRLPKDHETFVAHFGKPPLGEAADDEEKELGDPAARGGEPMAP